MKSVRLPTRLFFVCLSLFFLTTSCSAKTEAQKELGIDSEYFMGLTLLNQGKKKEAISKFSKCMKKGSYYCARSSAIELCKFGSLQDKNNECLKLLQKFPDEETLLIAARQFKESNEQIKLLEITHNIDFATASNELIRLRLEVLNERNDSSYDDEVYKWFTSRVISTDHYQFYRDYYIHPDFEQEDVDFTPRQFALNYRIELYKRNYTYTYDNGSILFDYFSSNELEPVAQLASDLGKAYLYGNMRFANNGEIFKKYATTFTGSPIEYYFWFYAGRLFEKGGTYYSQTRNCYKKAMETAQSADQKDNALWYLLNSMLNYSLDSLISSLGDYVTQWSNPAYFDDFFETLISSLLISGRWSTFYTVYTAIDGYASNEIVAQFAYIYGRLVQEKLITDENADSLQNTATLAFTRALKSDSANYYKILASYSLNVQNSKFSEMMFDTNYAEKNVVIDKAAENLLKGCALFGFPEKVYPLWLKYNSKGISTEVAFYLSDFLRRCSNGEDDYLQQSLRIACRAAAVAQRPLKKEEFELIYPENYLNFVDTSCKKYDIKKSIVFALIRSESFFDPDVVSSAGAVGLTQLMELTSGDIAHRLKYKEYSLEEPQTNIDFGTYYLSELLKRCQGSYLQAFFSYNAGITRVRRWLKSSIVEFGKMQNLPMDLFLETLPYAETREYGRKLISASVMYEWLYGNNNLSYSQIVKEFIR